MDYEDQPKLALLNGQLEKALKKANFDHLACVSGWVDIFAEEVMKLETLEKRKEALYELLKPLFPDKNWFLEKLVLIQDTDNRCSHIDLNIDWFYVDDWADKFFIEAQNKRHFQKEKDKRILLCDHQNDGSDILSWLRINCQSS